MQTTVENPNLKHVELNSGDSVFLRLMGLDSQIAPELHNKVIKLDVRQTDKQTGRSADRQTARQADMQTDRQTGRQTGDRQIGRQPCDMQTGRHAATLRAHEGTERGADLTPNPTQPVLSIPYLIYASPRGRPAGTVGDGRGQIRLKS